MSRAASAGGSAPGSVYYQHSGTLPLASRLSLRARTRMFELFMNRIAPTSDTRVLDVGVTSDSFYPESNYFERWYPHPSQVTAVGTEDGSHLVAAYPGLTYKQVEAGKPLPFADHEFDVVFSNAVLEHVGGAASQAAFIAELRRVARRFFITTPHRWFPVEHHTGIPLLHYLPVRVHRAILGRTRFAYWGSEDTLSILTPRSLRALFPSDAHLEVESITTMGLPSNLVAIGRGRA